MTTCKEQGFTLIEVILALVVSSVLTVMLSTYLGAFLTKSNDPISRLRSTLDIYSIMENIQITYDNDFDQSLSDLKTAVGSAAGNPHTNSYGTYNIIYNEYVSCDASTTTTFTGPSGSTILMLTISDPTTSGIRITSLFTE